MSAFSSITTALIAVLSAEPALSANIFRARDRAMAEEYATAINVQCDGATPSDGAIAGAPVDWASTFSIECYARSAAASGDLAVDPLLDGVYARLAADTTLGGLVGYIGSPRLEFEYDAQGMKTGWVRMTYQIEHGTSNLTLE
jgi:hypothetical protein